MPRKAAQPTDDLAQLDPIVTVPVIADPDVPQQEVNPEEESNTGTPFPDDPSPNLAQAILLMTNKLCHREDQPPTH